MPILNFIQTILFFYLIIYCIYIFTLYTKAFSAKGFLKEQKYLQKTNIRKNRLCVIVWANSKHKRLKELLHALNEQSYDRQNYDVHCIIERGSESATPVPDSVYGAMVHLIENPEFFSKDKAISAFIERLLPENRYDAFVFVGADRLVDSNYLEHVNANLYESSILTGRLEVRTSSREFDKVLAHKILSAKQHFVNNTINIARRMFDLATVLDAENCVMSSDILEKTGRICFETRNDELKYSLFLASNDLKPLYCPFMVTSVDVENFNASTANAASRNSLFRYYLPLLRKKPWYFVEFVFSMLKPGALFAIIVYFTILSCSFTFKSNIDLKYVVHLGMLFGITFFVGILGARLKLKEYFYLALYPLCSLILHFNIVTKKLSVKGIQKQIKDEDNVNSATITSVVSDGNKDLVCKLDLVSEDGLRKVVFRFKKKRFVSDAHLRMYDAMGDISQKLKSKGYTIKVCQNCGNFNSSPDGTVDLLKGFCKLKLEHFGPEAPDENTQTLIWNSCGGFLSLGISGIIDNMTNKGVQE